MSCVQMVTGRAGACLGELIAVAQQVGESVLDGGQQGQQPLVAASVADQAEQPNAASAAHLHCTRILRSWLSRWLVTI